MSHNIPVDPVKPKRGPKPSVGLDQVKELTSSLNELRETIAASNGSVANSEPANLELHPLEEMNALINLRGFVALMINNYNRSKAEVADIIAMSTLIDNKIVGMLLSSEFKDYIHFNEAKAAIAKARENNDIKSSLKIG